MTSHSTHTHNALQCNTRCQILGVPFHSFWSWTQKWNIYIDIFYWAFCNINTLQPFQICIFNRKYSKLTFSNGPQVMGKRFVTHLHASLDSTWESRFPRFPPDISPGGVLSTTFELELRNKRFTFISFMGFPAILSALQPFQMCFFNGKCSKLTFSNGPQLMGKRFMANLHASLDSTCKSRISEMCMTCQPWGVHSTTFDPELRNEFKKVFQWGGILLTDLRKFAVTHFSKICQNGTGDSASRFVQICKVVGNSAGRFEQIFLPRLIGEWIQSFFTKDQLHSTVKQIIVSLDVEDENLRDFFF